MNKVSKLFTVSTLALTLLTSASVAQDRHDNRRDDHHDNHDQNRHDDHHDDGNHYVHHADWRSGHRMDRNDWARGQRIDYRQYHLRAPRRGYEWRQVDGNYVLAEVATGLISSVIIASASR